MDKIIKKILPASEYRYALMGFGFEPYRVTRIEKIYRSDDYLMTLELNE